MKAKYRQMNISQSRELINMEYAISPVWYNNVTLVKLTCMPPRHTHWLSPEGQCRTGAKVRYFSPWSWGGGGGGGGGGLLLYLQYINPALSTTVTRL